MFLATDFVNDMRYTIIHHSMKCIYICRGHQPISEEDINRFYRGTHIGNDQIIPTKDNNVRIYVNAEFGSVVNMPSIQKKSKGFFHHNHTVQYSL